MRNSHPRKNMRFWKNVILLVLFVVAINYWLSTKSYLFDEKTVVEIGSQFSGRDVERKFKNIISELQERYPGHILPEQYREWVMVKSGGWIGSINILHVSLTEYLLFTGTAIDSQGHSGRHWANITLLLLSGSVKEWKEGTIQTILHQTGDSITLPWGHAGSFQWQADTWTLEYGRGFIPFSLPFFIADSVFSSFDLIGIFKMLKVFSRAYFYELKNELAHFIASI